MIMVSPLGTRDTCTQFGGNHHLLADISAFHFSQSGRLTFPSADHCDGNTQYLNLVRLNVSSSREVFDSAHVPFPSVGDTV